jgi:hypothetical protein
MKRIALTGDIFVIMEGYAFVYCDYWLFIQVIVIKIKCICLFKDNIVILQYKYIQRITTECFTEEQNQLATLAKALGHPAQCYYSTSHQSEQLCMRRYCKTEPLPNQLFPNIWRS